MAGAAAIANTKARETLAQLADEQAALRPSRRSSRKAPRPRKSSRQ
jgi:hypothetical protein